MFVLVFLFLVELFPRGQEHTSVVSVPPVSMISKWEFRRLILLVTILLTLHTTRIRHVCKKVKVSYCPGSGCFKCDDLESYIIGLLFGGFPMHLQ